MDDDKNKDLEKRIAELGEEGEEGKKKVELLNELASNVHRKDPEQAERLGLEALAIAEKLGARTWIAASSRMIGTAHLMRGNFETALERFTTALEIFEELGDEKGAASARLNMGNVYQNFNKHDQALKYYNIVLGFYEGITDKQGRATVLNNMGVSFMAQGDLDEALETYRKALKLYEELDFKPGIAYSNGNIATIYLKQEKLEKALESYLAAEKIFEELADKRSLNISSIYVGSLYTKLGDFDKALATLEKAKRISKEIGARDMEMASHLFLSEMYEAKEDFEQALENYKKYSEINGKIFSEDNEKRVTQLRVKYESERKVREIEIFKSKTEELEREVRDRTAELENRLADRRRVEDELKEKLSLINKQQAAIFELSTPIIRIWEGVLVVPLIGVLDTARAEHFTEELLASIKATQSRVAIIDITGVPSVDSSVANHLLKTVESVRLQGARCVVTGIRPEVAQTIIHLGIDISELKTTANLASGLVWAFRRIGERGFANA